MFYSQFILAKKGPLGTIWIAAHLERKLRKNQVADTDIGESVDSILFPDVPIALRLSSHLLLGVVRIYSRKVNYLFNDCSETLVKIKQAFRSSAVDLPPDASTAPYHSITLPETFDLDDLELPESSFCHGNFVDHHVTTREQITLQDPVEDTAYLGSQFGLDERFGDGDAPQMGLDFDEDIFAVQVRSPGPSSAATHLEEDVYPSAAATEGACSNKMEIEGQQSSNPAIGSSHLDEKETRDHSTMQTITDCSAQKIGRDYSDVLPPPVGEVTDVASKGIHRPDLNKEIFPCPMVQGPSTPRLMDEILTAHLEEVPVSSSLQKNKLLNSVEAFVAAVPSQKSSASYSMPGLSKRPEQVEMVMMSQHSNSHQSEEMKEADTGIPNIEGVQPYKEGPKEQLLLAQNAVLQQSTTLHTHENVNLVRSANPLQEIMMKPSKEMPTVASNLQCTASSSSLAVGTIPSPSVYAYGFDTSKQILPVHNMEVPGTSVQSTDTVFRAQDMCVLGLQQHSQIANWKKQSHSNSVSQEIAQISQMDCNRMSNTEIQQNPLPIPAISTYLSSQQFTPASCLQAAVGISGTQHLTIHGPSASATGVPRMQQVSPMEVQQLNKVAQSKQQVQFSVDSQEHVQEANTRNSLMSTSTHDNVTAMPTMQSCLSGQQFDLPSGFHSVLGTSCTPELPIHGFPSLLRPMPNKQEASTMGSIQHLTVVADKQKSYLGAATHECVQFTQPDNFVASTIAQDFNKPMQSFPSSGERHNISLGHHSTISLPDTRQNPGNTPEPANFASQILLSPQRLHVTETSTEVSSIAATEGPWLRACNEEEKKRQSLHASAAAGNYSLHGVQHVDTRTGGSASIFQSSDIPRVSTNIPLENTNTKSPSIYITTGEQWFSKGLPDGSVTTQPCNVPLEIGTNGKHRDVPSGNILQGARLPMQVGTFGACENASFRSILDTRSFATNAGTNAVSSHLASENILLQGNDFPKVTGSERFSTNITASTNSAPPFQHQAFSMAYDELSNALAISQVQGAAISKSEHLASIQSEPETVKRTVPEIPVYETLRSSVDSVRHEPDIFGLKRPRAENETPREADKSSTISKQSVGSKKHHMMDRTPILKTFTPNPRSRSSLSNRSMDFIPHDDDVLASILGRTPSFKIKPTPEKTVSAKRPKPTPRTGRKRKAVLDIAMVIDSNFIKQQLANTEDIRRVRKKAPCTLQEIRMIQKESQVHYIFFEPSIPGLCTELHDLYGQVFGSTGPKILLDDKDENSAETHKIQEPASSLGLTNDSRLEKPEQVRIPLEIVSAETQKRKEPTSSMGPTNDSSVVQLERMGRPLEIVSAETLKVQQPARNLSSINDSRVELEQVGRPLEIVSQMESIGVYVDNAHKNMHMGNADGIRVGVGDEYAKQEHGRLLDMSSVIKIFSSDMDNIHGKQENEKPEEIAAVAESIRVHLDDFHKEPEQEKLQANVSEVISSRGDMSNVHKSQDQETKKIAYETESSRLHMSDVYQKQEKESHTEMGYGAAYGRVAPNVESSRIFTVAIHQKQDQERPQEMVVESESGRAYIGEVDQKQEMSREMIYDMESSRMDVDDVQGKPTSTAALLQSPINVIHGSKDPYINKTLEASVMQQGNGFSKEVFVPCDNTFGRQFLGPPDVAQSGFPNIRETYLLNRESPSKPSWLEESHEKSFEDRRGLQGVAAACWASEGQKVLTEDPEVALKKQDVSNCLAENHRIHVLQGNEGTNIDCVNQVSKIFCGSKTSYIQPNIAQDIREQNQEIPDIAILERLPVNENIEETVKDCEDQNQVVCYNASLSPLQGKDSTPHNEIDLGECVDLTMPGKVQGSSVQNFGVENKKQDEQVLVRENSTEMFCKEPEVCEDISLRDRQDQQGPNPVVIHTATDEDEDFGFLGDADNTEFLVVDDDAQGDFEGRSKAPVTEEDQIQENSGWSARTRAVSRYLKTAFESMDYGVKKPETECRQKLSLDRLLVGKRRKEAARMFFETLVLKTRDYVDVEQKDSFNDISICPRAKLMKASF